MPFPRTAYCRAANPFTRLKGYEVYSSPAKASLRQSEFVNLHSRGPLRIIELNRPSALHAINAEMVDVITEALKSWQENPHCKLVLLRADNSKTKVKSFCAGGDVVAMVNDALTVKQRSEFFKKEYHLNHLIGTFKKPIISILDGITMGGGAGLSVHGSFRIATESTVFAMPETAIGFFPDEHLGFNRASHAGIATHYIPSRRIDDVVESLANLDCGADNLAAYLEQFCETLDPFSLDEDKLRTIDECFSKPAVSEIFHCLEHHARHGNAAWSAEILSLLRIMSPTALAVTHAMLQRAKSMTFKRCLAMEYELAKNFMASVADMREGVTSKLIRKEKTAKWNPATLDAVSPQFVNSLFQPTVDPDRLEFSNDIDYEYYPHRDHALPTRQRLRQLVYEHRQLDSREALTRKLLDANHHKLGLCERLEAEFAAHVRTRKELESQGRAAASNLTWID